MTQAQHRAGFWRSLRELPDRTPLRVKMITAVLALVILALAVISAAGIYYVRGYLLNRADNELQVLQAVAENSNSYGIRGSAFSQQVGERSLIEAIDSSGQAFQFPGYPASKTDPKVPTSPLWLAANAHKPVTVPAQSGDDKWRIMVRPGQVVQLRNGQQFKATVVVGIDVTDIYATTTRLEAFDFFVSLGILLLLGILAAAAVRASLRPLTDIEKTAEAIAAGDLGRRVPERDPRTEVGRLGRSLNVMLTQIESAFLARSRSERAAKRSEQRMRQFVADASHELRTPLTAIRGFAEYYRQRGGVATGQDDRDAADEVLQGEVVELDRGHQHRDCAWHKGG